MTHHPHHTSVANVPWLMSHGCDNRPAAGTRPRSCSWGSAASRITRCRRSTLSPGGTLRMSVSAKFTAPAPAWQAWIYQAENHLLQAGIVKSGSSISMTGDAWREPGWDRRRPGWDFGCVQPCTLSHHRDTRHWFSQEIHVAAVSLCGCVVVFPTPPTPGKPPATLTATELLLKCG